MRVRSQGKSPSYKNLLNLVIVGVLLCTSQVYAQKAKLRSKLTTVTSENGQKLKVESGTLEVPENRTSGNKRNISIAYQRVKSTSKSPGAAIFLLAGGPGGSWINTFPFEERFQEVLFYRQFCDVILFDQRGAGESTPNLSCKGKRTIPLNEPLTTETRKTAMRLVAVECRDYWLKKGVDLSAYNTDESARDLDDLRKALGYDKIILIGGSYGSHLGLHYLRKFPEAVYRAIFYGIEGPDHTWDIPGETLNALQRIASYTEQSEYYKNLIPEEGLIEALRSVLKKVEEKPARVSVLHENKEVEVAVNKLVIQTCATYRAGKRYDPMTWPDLILAMYKGDFSFPAQVNLAMRTVNAPNAMSNMMDFASGISHERRLKILNDPAQVLLGDINFVYTYREGIWPYKYIGDTFRKNVKTDIPILLIHGTWDLSTPLENAEEIAASLQNGHLIKVLGGTHDALYDLFEHWPPVYDLLESFLLGKKTTVPREVNLPDVIFPEPNSPEQISLWDACIGGDVKTLKKAIQEGADINALDTRKNRNGRRPLNWAAWYGHTTIIELLLKHGADINAQNNSGYTAIHHAAENCKPESFELLWKHKADIDITNYGGRTVLQTAKKVKCKAIVKFIRSN